MKTKLELKKSLTYQIIFCITMSLGPGTLLILLDIIGNYYNVLHDHGVMLLGGLFIFIVLPTTISTALFNPKELLSEDDRNNLRKINKEEELINKRDLKINSILS